MIKHKKDNFFRFWANKDKYSFGPFENIWIKGNYIGKEFDIKNKEKLKSRKNCAGIWAGKIFIFEDKDGKLVCLDII